MLAIYLRLYEKEIMLLRLNISRLLCKGNVINLSSKCGTEILFESVRSDFIDVKLKAEPSLLTSLTVQVLPHTCFPGSLNCNPGNF